MVPCKFVDLLWLHPDLKAFEQRLIECVSYTKAKTKKWKGKGFCSYVKLHVQ